MGREYKKKNLHLELTLLMIGTIPPLTLYALVAWRGTTSPFSFTYTQTEIADTNTRAETNPRKSLHHMVVQNGVKIFSSYGNKYSALSPYRIKVVEQLISLDWGIGSHNSRRFQKTVAVDFSSQNSCFQQIRLTLH